MRLRFRYISILALAILSCNDDLVITNTVSDTQMVVNAAANNGEQIELEVIRPNLITEDTFNRPISGVQVELLKNGTVVETRYTGSKGQIKFATKAVGGDSLTLRMLKEDFEPANSTIKAPFVIPILQFDTTTRRSNVLGCRVSFYDPVQDEDFYQLEMVGYRWFYKIHPITGKRQDSIWSTQILSMRSVNKLFFSDNNIINNRQSFELLNDKIFNGKNFVLDVDISAFVLEEQPDRGAIKLLRFELNHIDKAYYDFLSTISLNRPVYGGPFSIASQVPTNIEGGLGIFAATASDTAFISLE